MSDREPKRRPAGLRTLTRTFGSEFGRGYHAAGLSMYEAIRKHYKLLCDRYGREAANEYLNARLTLDECDALHVVRQQRELADLAAAQETRLAEMMAKHEKTVSELVASFTDHVSGDIARRDADREAWLKVYVPPRPHTLRGRIAAAFDALLNR